MEHKEVNDEFSDITLRLLDLSDIDDFMVWVTDDKVSQFCSWETYTSKEAAVNYIVNFVIPHPWFRAICLKGRPIGAITVTPCGGNDIFKAELGYVLGSQYWGKGIVTRAVKLVASTIFIEWPHLERLEALVDVNNPGSQKVLEKAGFLREGVLRKYILQKGKARDMGMWGIMMGWPLPSIEIDSVYRIVNAIRLFLSEESPSQVGFGSQDHLQAKTSWLLHSTGLGPDDNLPPGFEGAYSANLLKNTLAPI
ncbi:hypothetical protein F0562_000339 [Nyssa sinensis]|uniref:N-acetyltransferase domain-containing protein n=1 Tax=Nyssa sinensis TaxID=561372 RepID=A0A5J5BZV0_9ASTE|nr:hypothetical protein F0562_000339 [Nyssa sinensis]